ncbi:MAG: MHFG family PEP-CTERM protein [Burkholderiaceae bacterium]|nr:MHFG family PEP-CTERM protein [Burkholderiaceae bacterium]
MSLTLATLLAAGAAVPAPLPACSWDRPGHEPFMGDVVAAVDRYADIPAPTRARLKSRMASRSYDEIVSIRRDAIVGKGRYQSDIREMHFGNGQVCATVSRAQWNADHAERGLVYCEDGHCILVPTVCRNVSRITRDSPPAEAAAAAPAAEGAGGGGGPGGRGGGAPPVAVALAPLGGEAAAPQSFVSALEPPAGTSAHTGTTPGWTGGGEAAAVGPVAVGWALGGYQSPLGLGRPATQAPTDPGTGGGLPGGGLPIGPPGVLPLLPSLPVPEPGTWLLMLGGLAALVWRARRR